MTRSIKVKYNKTIYAIEIDSSIELVGDLKSTLAEKTSTKADSIKLIIEGKQLKNDYSITELLNDGCRAGEVILKIHDDSCLTMIATKTQTKEVEAPQNHLIARVINDLSTDGVQTHVHPSQLQVNVHEVARKRGEYEFHRIEVLPGLPDQDKAKEILTSLANDPAVLAVMKKHKWSVGCLAELFPEGKVGEDEVCILGLNTNKGQKIELRIRTDDLKGFRKIQSIRKTLYHELTHNVHGPHDEKFYTLLRQVEKEIIELDWRSNQRGYSVKDDGKVAKKYASDQYIPNDTVGKGTTKTVYRLRDASSSSTYTPSSVPMYRIIPAGIMAAHAATLRLTEEEMENERSCGCGRGLEEKMNAHDITASSDDTLCMECDANDHDERLRDISVGKMDMVGEEVCNVSKSKEQKAVTSATSSDAIDFININSVIQEISNSLDESIAMSLNMDGSSSVERLLMIRESVQKILNSLNSTTNRSRREVYNSLGLLKTFIGNAKDLPDEKYRSIKANSKKFESLIIRIDGAMNLLEATGFEHSYEDKKVQLKRFDPVLLYMAFSFVDLCLNVIDRAINETTVPVS